MPSSKRSDEFSDSLLTSFYPNTTIPHLPSRISKSSSYLFPLIQALVCGGTNTLRSCLVFHQDDYVWQTHSTLLEDRYFHSVVVLPTGTYILGGYSSRFTSEFLPTGIVGKKWKPVSLLFFGGGVVNNTKSSENI